MSTSSGRGGFCTRCDHANNEHAHQRDSKCKTKLVSVYQLALEGISTTLDNKGATGYNMEKEGVYRGLAYGGLYRLKENEIAFTAEYGPEHETAKTTLLVKVDIELANHSNETMADLLHRRLGHLNYAYI